MNKSSSQWRDALKGCSTAAEYSDGLNNIKQHLHSAFKSGEPVETLLHRHSGAVDSSLEDIWVKQGLNAEDITLVATGGYGRSELHPSSDIDLLILINDSDDESMNESISQFITLLWDIGLDIGSAVRTLQQCKEEAEKDLSTMTSLIESRLICGNRQLWHQLEALLSQNSLWNSRDFYAAKMEELETRNNKFGHSAYKLEPNIKESPGGLRDMHLIGWVFKRHYKSSQLEALIGSHFLAEDEFNELTENRNFLWSIRWVLHIITKRKEDRLLFDYQFDLAKHLGFERETRNQSIETFMQKYYLAVTSLERLTTILLQYFDEEIIFKGERVIKPINEHFQTTNNLLGVTKESIFSDHPAAMLELFLIYQKNHHIKGIRAATIRMIRDNLHLIDDTFRRDPANRKLFISLLHQPAGITQSFRYMHFFGVLDAYLPVFRMITGRMQFDLFHIYTVDEHILMVLRNTRRLSIKAFAHELPECSSLFKEIDKPEILYIAALFHDIGKGRDGDHSEIGEVETRLFCEQHDLNKEDTDLIAWLVKNHLHMSLTAQRKDIEDPEIINEFAQLVSNKRALLYLYLLTVCDIIGTDPNLWNGWKSALLSRLYHRTVEWLDHYQKRQPGAAEFIDENKNKAYQLLVEKVIHEGHTDKEIDAYLNQFHDEYFLRFSDEETVWHWHIMQENSVEKSVFVRSLTDKGTTEILIHAKVKPGFFTRITRGIQLLNLTILDARIYTTRSGHSIDSFQVLEQDNSACNDDFRLLEIEESLERHLQSPVQSSGQHALPRILRAFDTPTVITLTNDTDKNHTELDITAADRPGLLADIAELLHKQQIRIIMARITTAGETARDTLHITNDNNEPLDSDQQSSLRSQLMAYLSDDGDAS